MLLVRKFDYRFVSVLYNQYSQISPIVLCAQQEPTSEPHIDNEVEDSDDDGCFITDHVTGCRSAELSFYRRHKFHLKAAVLAVLATLYFAYFGFALHYRFGDEGSIRLLWITCLVVFILLLKLIMRCLRPQLEQLSSSQTVSYIRQHQRHINWLFCVFLIYN